MKFTSLFKTLMLAIALSLPLASSLSACNLSSPSYQIQVVLSSAPGLFAGNAVEILGVPVGSVSDVVNKNNTVLVTMSINSGVKIPQLANASLVAPELLGEPSIELSPGYVNGPSLQSGSTIPMSRTSVPVSIGQLLKDLQTFLGQIDPNAAHSVIVNLSQDLSNQGAALGQLIGHAADMLRILAQKGNELGNLNGSLASITGALRNRTATIVSLIQNYDSVTTVIDSQQTQLVNAVNQLSSATSELSALLTPNLGPLENDISTITTFGRTLSRNVSSLDQILASSTSLFQAAARAFDPNYNWLNLNNQLPPGTTSAIVEGLIRDRLAGICRRLVAHHSTGLSATQIATLNTCGNPNSGYFNSILGLVPGVLNTLPGAPPSQPTIATQLQNGLNAIPGLNQSNLSTPIAQGTTTSSSPNSIPTTTQALNLPSASTLPPLPTLQNNSSTASTNPINQIYSFIEGIF